MSGAQNELGFDSHALSAPAFVTSLEVLAANGAEVMIAAADEYTLKASVKRRYSAGD